MRILAFLSLSAAAAWAQDGITFGPAEGPFKLDVRTSLEAVVWAGDTPPPAQQEYEGDVFLAPRLSIDIDAAAGDHWLLHATPRIDRGFDAGSSPDGAIRLDLVFLRWRVGDDQRLNFQIGKYPSVFGAWSCQYDFSNDPFLLAPLPYSQIIGVNTAVPSATPFGVSTGGPGALPLSLRSKDQWASMLWGPGYGTGAEVFGASEHFDYAVEIKNTALSAHPDSWPELDFAYPTFSGRLGYRPDAAWAFGVSASRGPWPESNEAGVDRGDLIQNSLGFDARWAHHDLIVSGEVVFSQFETLTTSDLRAASLYVQARWTARPGMWLAARFGQLLANNVSVPGGADFSWQSDVWRAEIGSGWRITSNLLLKVDYSFTHTADDPAAGEHLFGTGLGWRF